MDDSVVVELISTQSLARSAGAAITRAWQGVWRGWSGRVGIVFVLIVVALAVIGPYVAPYSPTAIATGLSEQGPSWDHLLGTDVLGRDVLSRFLCGGRSLIVLSLVTALVAFALGATIGIVSGYKAGWVDIGMSRLVDVLLSLPPLLLVMLCVFALGTSEVVLAMVIAVFFAPRVARIIRGATHTICAEDYILAARARGESTIAIVFRELLPNMTGPMFAELAMRFTYTIIFISTLNFLGLGVQPPTPDWGLMISDGRILLTQTPVAVVAPALAIAFLAIGGNLISDELASHFSHTARDFRI